MDHICFRPKWEGGQYDGDENKRQKALQLAMELGADFIDIELKVSLHTFCILLFL
jgi:3-dehydroquinate dehydratase/shikimate dehydrogenase